MADYSDEIAFAQEAIAEDGFEAVLIKRTVSGSENDPTLGADPHTMKCVEFNTKEMVNGALVDRSMKTLMVSTEGLTVAPEQDDRVSFTLPYDANAASQPIIAVRPLQPAGASQVILWSVDLG